MEGITDDRGYNQVYKASVTTKIRATRRNNYYLNEIDHSKHNDILEIGCGLGDLSNHLAQVSTNHVIGADLCEPFIKQAQQTFKGPNLQYMVVDFNNPEPLLGKKFDYIVGNGILHHLFYELDEVLVNLKAMLKEGGKIIFLEPNIYNPYCYIIFSTTPFFRKWAKLEPTEKAFSKKFITKKLSKAGYNKIEVRYKDFLLPIIPHFLIKPVIVIGNIVEKIPFLRLVTQSIYITATR